MAEFGFQGQSALALDAKGRLTVPVRYRETLDQRAQGKPLTLVKHPDGCLMVFPEPAWLSFRTQIAELTEDSKRWKRFFLGAMDVEVDGAARLLIPPELRAFALLDKDVVLLGLDTHFELWDSRRHAAQEQEAMNRGLPEALKNLTY